MPRFEPFAALRYATDDLAAVVAPPYDVVSDADVDALENRSEHNIVRVDVPRGDDDRYARAAATLAAWREAGVLVADDDADADDLPDALHRRPAEHPATSPECSADSKSSTKRPAECCRTNGRRPRPRPTGWT